MSEWQSWPCDYEKVLYDVRLPDGTIIPHCWLNAGKIFDPRPDSPSAYILNAIAIRKSSTHPLDKKDREDES